MNSLARKLLFCAAFLLALILYARAHFYRDPGSIFFDKTRAYEQVYSHHRLLETEEFIRTAKKEASEYQKASNNATLCVAISSVKRQRTNYLETTIAGILAGLTPQERGALYLSVFISETDPEKHPSYRSPWIPRVVDNFHTYNVSESRFELLQDMEREERFLEKGVYDYRTALLDCYESGVPYIAVFEDDILMADGWMVRTLLGLREVEKRAEDWLYMRLFNQERSIGWAGKHIGGNYEFSIIALLSGAVLAPTYFLRSRFRFFRVHLESIMVFALFLIPSLVILFYQCGKASLMPPQDGIYAQKFGCCAQAMVMPRGQIPTLRSFLRMEKAGQMDTLLNRRARRAKLMRYAFYPVQAQHIGLDSARHTDEDEAQAVWSMAFEMRYPERAHKDHIEMVNRYWEL